MYEFWLKRTSLNHRALSTASKHLFGKILVSVGSSCLTPNPTTVKHSLNLETLEPKSHRFADPPPCQTPTLQKVILGDPWARQDALQTVHDLLLRLIKPYEGILSLDRFQS